MTSDIKTSDPFQSIESTDSGHYTDSSSDSLTPPAGRKTKGWGRDKWRRTRVWGPGEERTMGELKSLGPLNMLQYVQSGREPEQQGLRVSQLHGYKDSYCVKSITEPGESGKSEKSGTKEFHVDYCQDHKVVICIE